MAKKNPERREAAPEPQQQTHKQVRLSSRERRAQTYLYGAVGLVIISVMAVIAIGFLSNTTLNQNQAVVVVNGEEVTVEQFRKRVRLSYFLAVQRTAAGGDQQQAQAQIDTRLVGENTLDRILSDVLIRQLAEEMGITVSDEEVEQLIRDTIDPSVVAALQNPFADSEDDAEADAPTPTPTFVLTLTPSPTIEGEEGDDGEEPVDSPDATPAPTLPPQSEPSETDDEQIEELYQQQLADWSDASGMTEAEIRELFLFQVLVDKLLAELPIDVDDTEIQVLFGHIQLADQEEAEELLASINAGEQEFEVAAAELSLDPTTAYRGGLVDWITRAQIEGSVGTDFADIVFTMQPGDVGGPVLSPLGFHLIKVFDRQEVALSEGLLLQSQQEALQLYLVDVRVDADIVVDENWQRFMPALP